MSKVLIVDDEEGVRDIITRYVEQAGVSAEAVESAPKALEAMQREIFDVIITDIVMPGMSGFDLIREVSKKHPAIPIIVVTAFGTYDHLMEAMSLGAFNFITKPVKKEHLWRILEKGLRIPRFTVEKSKALPYLTHKIELTIPSRLELVEGVSYQIVQAAEAAGFPPKAVSFSIPMTTDELLINAIEHGNRFAEEKKVYINAVIDGKKFEILIRDEGSGFDVKGIPADFSPQDLLNERGRGIIIIKHYMDELIYNEKGNEVKAVLYRK
jgi:CheY-like chemotaxis protein